MPESVLFIQDLAVILVAATLCGYACARVGLSPIVGYLIAGLIVGTPEITVPYVTDADRIHIIGQLGVVFLMFAIGLQFRLRKLRELGIGIVLATGLTALLVLTGVRFFSGMFGLDPAAGLCLAAIFMVSSSAIIGKFVQDFGFSHRRFGKVALGMTLMEDIVAVVMLAVLGTYGAAEGVSTPSLGVLLLMLIGFVVSAVVVGLIAVPWVFRVFERRRQTELANIFVCGTLLMLAYLAVRAGYSLALGAFVFGLVVAETRQRVVVERAFQGLKDVFLTVFFATIGMMVDLHSLPAALPWIVLGTVGALVGRALAAFVALLIVGEQPRNALQAGLCVTAIGEFSFIIAAIGVGLGLFSDTLQVTAVGVALATSLVSPLLAQHSAGLTEWLSAERSPRLERWYRQYQVFRQRVSPQRAGAQLWELLRKRIFQVVREIVIVSALLLFAAPVYNHLLERGWGAFAIFGFGYWLAVALLCLGPIVSVWRNLSAVAMIVADFISREVQSQRRLATAVSHLLHVLYVLFLGLWLWNLLPEYLMGWWVLLSVVCITVLTLAFYWRTIIHWHNHMEVLLNESLTDTQSAGGKDFLRLRETGKWGYEVEEFTLPDDTVFAGMPLAKSRLRELTGASVVGIERSGFHLGAVGPGTHLFPGDQLLLLGLRDEINRAREVLSQRSDAETAAVRIEDLVLQTLVVSGDSGLCGKALVELDLPLRFGVQVVGIRRSDGGFVSPSATTVICAGDDLLLLGSPEEFKRLTQQLAG